ncbi:hypothetical protein BKA82DRAFT_34612 [Pisolithus tinctorius]|nr:hypothetical protein BKA82DRAFT_34612 [Pisolithus tinctorius]
MLIGYCCEAHLASAHGIVNMPRTQLVERGRCGKRMGHRSMLWHYREERLGFRLHICYPGVLTRRDGGFGAVQSFAIDICGSAGYDTPTPNSPALGMSRAPPTLVGNHLPGVVPERPVVTASTATL